MRPGESRVHVLGSTQRWFLNRPTVAILWNGTEVGTVEHGGRFSFTIVIDGVAGFRYSVRSTEIDVTCDGDTTIQLSWDRLWGRLVARTVDATTRGSASGPHS